MKNVQRIGISIALLCLLTISTFAGETSSPPCSVEPGPTNSPPCSVAQSVGDDSTTQDQAVSTASGSAADYSIGDVTVDVLLTALSLF